jgi:diguanylate cyclase (GGDEF) domain
MCTIGGKVSLRLGSKIWSCAVVALVIAQAVASIFLSKSVLLTSITDGIGLMLMVSASAAFARNASVSNHRQRFVWILLSAGYAIEACSQIWWMRWELVLKQIPDMSFGDGMVFLAWTVLILGFALRPHIEPTPQQQRLGIIDLLLLLLTGLYLYLFLVIPWQYLAPEPHTYGAAYKFLSLSEDIILLSIVWLGWRHTSGRWRHFYALLTGIIAFDTIMEYVVDSLANAGVYFSGGWYDSTTAFCLAGMTIAALTGHRQDPVSEHGDPESEQYWRWASRLAAPVILMLSLLASWSFLDRSLPASVWTFRVALSLVAIIIFASLGIVKQARLEKELAVANRELLDAAETDPLTGVRNRRFFTNSIEANVQQVLRPFVTNPSSDPRNRDLAFYLIDIDHFKRINDHFGHTIGDQILVEVARRINSAARLSDAVIRWGGEEFLLLSRYTDRKEAHVLANRVLDAVGSKPYSVDAGVADLWITCSIGWAVFPWNELEPRLVPHDQVLVLADYALYQAKGCGRNQAVGLRSAGGITDGTTDPRTVFVNGIPATPITTTGPEADGISAPGNNTAQAKSAAAATSS